MRDNSVDVRTPILEALGLEWTSKVPCSRVVTGNVRLVTGGVRVSFLGLFVQSTAIIKSLIGVIGSFKAPGADLRRGGS